MTFARHVLSIPESNQWNEIGIDIDIEYLN